MELPLITLTRFQVRIGNMDGIFVAYHNTSRLFGFQYVPLPEIDERLFGSPEHGGRVFEKCVGLLEALAEEVVACFPTQVSPLMVLKTTYQSPVLSRYNACVKLPRARM